MIVFRPFCCLLRNYFVGLSVVPIVPNALRTKCTASTIEAISKQASLNSSPVFIGNSVLND